MSLRRGICAILNAGAASVSWALGGDGCLCRCAAPCECLGLQKSWLLEFLITGRADFITETR